MYNNTVCYIALIYDLYLSVTRSVLWYITVKSQKKLRLGIEFLKWPWFVGRDRCLGSSRSVVPGLDLYTSPLAIVSLNNTEYKYNNIILSSDR
jgi:hypothetical protein